MGDRSVALLSAIAARALRILRSQQAEPTRPRRRCTQQAHAFGHLRYLAFYVAGGFVAAMTQALMTLIGGSAADAAVPMLGASGAIAAVLGAYFVLYPDSRIWTLVIVFPLRISAWVFLGLWFLYQLIEANFGLFSAGANGGGVAFFAHVGGFLFGVLLTALLGSKRLIQGGSAHAAVAGAGA